MRATETVSFAISQQVEKLIREGIREPAIIAARTGYPLEEVQQHLSDLTEPKTNLQILHKELDSAVTLLNRSKQEYELMPSASNSTAYVQILDQVRGLVGEIDDYDDPTETAELVTEVVQGFSRRILQIFVEGLSDIRDLLPQSRMPDVDDVLRKAAQTLTLRNKEAISQIVRLLGADSELVVGGQFDYDSIRSNVVDFRKP